MVILIGTTGQLTGPSKMLMKKLINSSFDDLKPGDWEDTISKDNDSYLCGRL
jgi:hypothetical protein